MSDILGAGLGRHALEVLTRLCDQGVRPPASFHHTRAPRTRAPQVNPTALAAIHSTKEQARAAKKLSCLATAVGDGYEEDGGG